MLIEEGHVVEAVMSLPSLLEDALPTNSQVDYDYWKHHDLENGHFSPEIIATVERGKNPDLPQVAELSKGKRRELVNKYPLIVAWYAALRLELGFENSGGSNFSSISIRRRI